MIFTFSDFGLQGPYVGQMRAAILRDFANARIVDLMHDAPPGNVRASAWLLAALVPDMPPDCVCLAVVDPGVGGERPPVVLEADGRRFVGPGNGLFEIVRRRARSAKVRRIDWRPGRLSESFHGRDLFAPAAAMLACGMSLPMSDLADPLPGADWPDDLAEVIYTDRFGNVMTGLRAAPFGPEATFGVSGQILHHARTFCEASPGQPFWYVNSIGLVELAVNGGSAADMLGIRAGDAVTPAPVK